jgi:hypothetical protein
MISRWFLDLLILRPWRWRRYVLPKCQLTFNGLHGVISQKIVLFSFQDRSVSVVPRLRFGRPENQGSIFGRKYRGLLHRVQTALRPIQPPVLGLCKLIDSQTQKSSQIITKYFYVLDIVKSWKYKKFWEELIAYSPLVRHGPHTKRSLQLFFLSAGMSLPSYYLVTLEEYTDKPTDTHVQQIFYWWVPSLPRERVYWAIA